MSALRAWWERRVRLPWKIAAQERRRRETWADYELFSEIGMTAEAAKALERHVAASLAVRELAMALHRLQAPTGARSGSAR